MLIHYSLLLSLALPVQADTTNHTKPLDELFRCETIISLDERDTCFKNETAKLRQAIDSGNLVVVDQELATEQTIASFGLRNPVPVSPHFEIEAPQQINSTLSSSGQLAQGKYRFILADGSSWIQIDSDPIRLRPREGTEVTVKRAALGSYYTTLFDNKIDRQAFQPPNRKDA